MSAETADGLTKTAYTANVSRGLKLRCRIWRRKRNWRACAGEPCAICKRRKRRLIGKRKHNYGIPTAVRLARIEAELPHLATKCELMSIDGGSKALQTDDFIYDKLPPVAERSLGERLTVIEWTIPNLVTKAELERARGYRRAMRVFPWRRLSGDRQSQDDLFGTRDILLMLLAPCLTVLLMYLVLLPLIIKLFS